GAEARSRLISSAPPRPSSVSSVTITAGFVRAASSTARRASVVTSSCRSAPLRIRAYCSWARPSAVSQRRTVTLISAGYRPSPVVRAQLLEDPLQVGLHRVRGDPEVAGHLLGGGAVRHHLEDLALTLGQG